MFKIFSSAWPHNVILTKWCWRAWVFLYFMVSGLTGCCSLVTVYQPPVITAVLGHDVILPCQVCIYPGDMLLTGPVLYWVLISQDAEEHRLWNPSEKHVGRVQLLDENPNSLNKSILLKNVQWADNGKYNCKLSITTKNAISFRSRGNNTLLAVYDAMTFNLTAHSDSLLRCEINVTREAGFHLSIVHNGCEPQSVDSAPEVPAVALPYVTLSANISLRGGGKYECLLHMSKDLITKSIFHHLPPVAEGCGDAGGNYSTGVLCFSGSDVVECPEPWILYSAVLLVPVIVLLGLVTGLLCRC